MKRLGNIEIQRKKLLLGYIMLSKLNTLKDRFIRSKDKIVTDTSSGLMWIQKAYIFEKPDVLKRAAEVAKTLKIGGYSNWRLPTSKELIALVDVDGSVYDMPIFKDMRLTSFSPKIDYACLVDINGDKVLSFYVWFVRDNHNVNKYLECFTCEKHKHLDNCDAVKHVALH